MGNVNNPAGRLHTLLSEYRSVANTDVTIHQTWANVLNVAEGDVPIALAEVAALIPAIERLVNDSGQVEQVEVWKTFGRTWAIPVMTEQHPRQGPSPGPDLVNPSALAALGGLSAYFSSIAPEGVVPDQDRVAELRADVSSLLADLVEDQSLPPELKVAINARLHDVLWAMDHVRVGGPGAVQQATERLLGQIIIHSESTPEARKSGFLKKVLKAIGVVWVAYKAGPEAHAALQGWQDVLKELPPGG